MPRLYNTFTLLVLLAVVLLSSCYSKKKKTEELSITTNTDANTEIIKRYLLVDTINEENTKKYLSKNQWIPAKINWNKTIFKGQIKAHGKHPQTLGRMSHLCDNRFSIRVKLNKGKIKDQKDFSLIIPERIGFFYHQLSFLSEQYNLYHIPVERLDVKINETEQISYFEPKTKNEFLSSIDSNFVLITIDNKKHHYYNRSGIYFNNLDSNLFFHLLTGEIDSMHISMDAKNTLMEDYLSFNRSIISDQMIDTSWFDLHYMAYFESIRSIMKMNGHGFEKNNLVLVYHKQKRKFYPFFHRDCFIHPKPYEKNEIAKMDKYLNHLYADEIKEGELLLGPKLNWISNLYLNPLFLKQKDIALKVIINEFNQWNPKMNNRLESFENTFPSCFLKENIDSLNAYSFYFKSEQK